MSQPNAGADSAASPTATLGAPTVLVTVDDAISLRGWAENVGTDLNVIEIEFWTVPVAPNTLPEGEIFIIAETRETKAIFESIKALSTSLSQTGREPRLIETTMPLGLLLSENMTWDKFTEATVAKPAGRAPAADKQRAARTSDKARCLTAMGVTVMGEDDKQEVILPWAAYEVETSQVGPRSLIALGVSYKAESGQVVEVRLDNVEGSTLDSFEWMEADKNIRKLERPENKMKTLIANAIRSADGPKGEVSLARTGGAQMAWIDVDGMATYVKTDAGLNADGLDRAVYGGNLEASGETYFWGKEVTPAEEKTALRKVIINMPRTMLNPDVWLTLLAQNGRATTPTAAMVPIILYGLTSSGKTVTARAASGLSSIGLLSGELNNFNATKVAVEMIASQFATGICLIDDIPPCDDPNDLKRLRESVDELIRVGHPEGSLKDRGGISAGGVTLAARAEVHPCVLVTTEENLIKLMPRKSARNRALGIHIVRGEQFDSLEESIEFEDLAREFAPTAGYAVTRWMAGQIDAAGGIKAYSAQAKKQVDTMTTTVMKKQKKKWAAEPRVYMVCAALLHGLAAFGQAARDCGAIDEVEYKSFITAGSSAIETLFTAYVENWLSDVEGIETIADIWMAIRAGRGVIGETCLHKVATGLFCGEGCGLVRTIGKSVTLAPGQHKDSPEGGEYMALSPGDVADVLSRPGSPRTKDQIEKQLLTVKGSIKGYRTRLSPVKTDPRPYCVLVPKSIFQDETKGLIGNPDGVEETDENAVDAANAEVAA